MLFNEMKKIKIHYWFFAILIIAVLLNILQLNVTTGYTLSNWRAGAEAEKQVAYEMMDKKDLDDETKADWGNLVKELDYCLENDIPYNVMNMFSYANSMGGMDTFLYLILIICTSRILYIEDKSKTWKNLFTTPKSKKKILATKMSFAFLVTFAAVIIFFAISLIFGAVKYGTEAPLKSMIYLDGELRTENVLTLFFYAMTTVVAKALVWEGILFLVLALKENYDVAGITITIVLTMCSEMIADIIPEKIGEFLPFEQLSVATTTQIHSMAPMLVVLLPYVVVFWALFFVLFRRTV